MITCRLDVEDYSSVYDELNDDFMVTFEKLQENRAQTEKDIYTEARDALTEAETKLNTNCPKYGDGNFFLFHIRVDEYI